MLALRRISTVYQHLYPLSLYQYRYKSKTSNNDESKSMPLSEELLNFERKDFKTPRNLQKNTKYSSNEDRIDRQQSISRKSFHWLVIFHRFFHISR